MRLKIKAAAISVIVGITMLLVSGCNVIPNDISELETPPKLTADQQSIMNALESYTSGKLTFKYPLEGSYRSAFVLRDIDHDGKTNAVAFYSPGSSAAAPHIAVLDKSGKNWRIVNDLGSEGSEIDSISFGDFNGDKHDDMAVGWRTFNSTDLTLIVYMRNGHSFSKENLGTYTKLKTLDMTGNGKTDILILKLDNNIKSAQARLFSYKNGKLVNISHSPLDSTVTNYIGMYSTKIDGHYNAVLVDGNKGENNYITEMVEYKNGDLLSPLYDIRKHTVNATLRFVNYKCMDIDGDGIVEVPMAVELPPYGNSVKTAKKNWLVSWSVFSGSGNQQVKLSCIMNYSENYYFICPSEWGKNVTVKSEGGSSIWDFCKWDDSKNTYSSDLFTIYVYTDDVWNTVQGSKPIYKLAEKNGTVYAVDIPESSSKDKYALTFDEIKKNFKLLK